MKTKKSEYDIQAEKFLTDTETQFSAEFLKYDKHFEKDSDRRDIYKITLTRGNRAFVFNFGQSIVNSGLKFKNKNTGRVYCVIPTDEYFKIKDKKHSIGSTLRAKGLLPFQPLSCDCFEYPVPPTAYDVLACLTKDDPESFEFFCSNYGYDTDSRKAEKIYRAVVDEYHHICMLWNETEIEQLREIQ